MEKIAVSKETLELIRKLAEEGNSNFKCKLIYMLVNRLLQANSETSEKS